MDMSTGASQVNEAVPRYPADTGAQDVPPGYKQTNAGIIPEDWDVTTLGALGRTLSGGTPRSSDARFWGGDIPWVSSKDMKVTRLRDAIDHVTPLAIGNGTRIVQPGTILMVVRGMSLAHSFPVALVEEPVAFNQDLKAFVPHATHSGDWILRWLEANDDRILLLATEATHGTKRLPTGDLLGTAIPLPLPREQRAIAEALSDVDGLLGALEALIAKKRATKQAAMQQLLTGKTRLPGFSGEWETKRLGEIGHFLKGRGVKRDDAQSGPLACVRYGEIYTAHDDWVRTFHSWISPEVAATATRLEYGDLLFAGSGETKEEIGKCVAILTAVEAYSGGDIVILRPSNVDALFFGYALNMPRVARQKASLGQGDAVVHISAAALAQVSLAVPSIEEQTAIATVLSDIDAEIAALERRRDKTRAIKQGMMQQLLTGRVRLVQSSQSEVARC